MAVHSNVSFAKGKGTCKLRIPMANAGCPLTYSAPAGEVAQSDQSTDRLAQSLGRRTMTSLTRFLLAALSITGTERSRSYQM